jgi:hypothetical protein
MKQSKLESFIESAINVFSGTVISLLLWMYVVAPLWNFQTSFYDNLGITGIFTIAAIARGYIWRRFFNAGVHKKVHRLLTKDKQQEILNI